MSEPTMYNSTSATTSPSTSTRTSAQLIYTITFKPNSAGSPDLVTYRGISNISITLSTGESCTVKQRGGMAARKRRNEYRKQKLPNGKDSNALVENAKEKQKKQKDELAKENDTTKEKDRDTFIVCPKKRLEMRRKIREEWIDCPKKRLEIHRKEREEWKSKSK